MYVLILVGAIQDLQEGEAEESSGFIYDWSNASVVGISLRADDE